MNGKKRTIGRRIAVGGESGASGNSSMMASATARREVRVPDEALNPAAPPPVPGQGERPVVYADRIGEWYAAQKSNEERKAHGLYLTPVPVADFMAERFRVAGRPHLRLLDPAAGSGVLACAAVEALASGPDRPRRIDLVAHEIDAPLTTHLRAVFDYLVEWCEERDVLLHVSVRGTDFIMEHAAALQFSCGGILPPRRDEQDFDLVIANPPYFKISRTDPRAMAAAEVVHGQPNIYGLFMAVSAALLKADGDFVFIVPRSFASGPYFRRFRMVFMGMIRPVHIHVFDSRRDAFRRDEVLQENIIFVGVRDDRWDQSKRDGPLTLSSSRGTEDIHREPGREVAVETVFAPASADKVLRLPLSDEDDAALRLVDQWPCTLRDLGLDISTGPVVPFRATGLIDEQGEVPTEHVPLLWMNHVRAMEVEWPIESRKPEFLRREGAATLLVPNRNYVLVRRFSAKEERRRLIAAPWIAGCFPVPEIGIENHLNYIHRPNGTLLEDEARGLAALCNSRLLDVWFRTVNGNTQVSATELRSMHLPARGTIIALGRRVKRLANPMDGLDALVMELAIPPETRPKYEEMVVGG